MRGIYSDNDTIAAIATPPGNGGIGIIKISGNKAVDTAASVFQPSSIVTGLKNNDFPKSRHLYHGHVIDHKNRQTLDEVLLVVMSGPASYTGEDVVEIQAHSGIAVLQAILELVMENDIRLADPGEFTRRAFLNGRIDLTQAEAVIDVIQARSAAALDVATSHAAGSLRVKIEKIRDDLSETLVNIEAVIDFSDDVEENLAGDRQAVDIEERVIAPLEEIIRAYDDGRYIIDGLKVAIVGRPNVGKSSLLNCLLEKEKAIVTPVPGTTRDLVEDIVAVQGIPVVIADTAGIHDSDDPVEIIGMEKTRQCIKDAHITIFVIDAANPFCPEDCAVHEAISDKNMIIAANKQDIAAGNDNADQILEMPENWHDKVIVKTSALYNKGIDNLKNEIEKAVTKSRPRIKDSSLIPNLRQKTAIEKSLNSAQMAVSAIKSGMPDELVAIDIKESIQMLDEITGADISDDLLDRIFGQFCIGK
ncbi:tRNA uridine-5-carboxymethylaminomethyl(34) synthesis GTPase MnmE [Desulfobacterales bacterium HSG16]|nr:tRNA uridine-5-carboxymethylaminomethyl(34) synthesis GTPase MnmE [Desulfobacterales bacterium HSG16]